VTRVPSQQQQNIANDKTRRALSSRRRRRRCRYRRRCRRRRLAAEKSFLPLVRKPSVPTLSARVSSTRQDAKRPAEAELSVEWSVLHARHRWSSRAPRESESGRQARGKPPGARRSARGSACELRCCRVLHNENQE